MTKDYVDQREAAVLSYSVLGLLPQQMTVDFYMKEIISDYSIKSVTKESLKSLAVSFDILFEINSKKFD